MVIICFFVVWFICSLPFVMMGVPANVSVVLGLVAEIVVFICMACSSAESSPQKPAGRPGSKPGISDKDSQNMIMLDMMDGKPDGKFGFFDFD